MTHGLIRQFVLAVLLLLARAGEARAQDPAQGQLDSLIARALDVHPRIRAAGQRVEAARTRIDPAGALPDPMLMAGIENLPLRWERASESGPDPMTMRTIGVGQTIPFPGKLPLQRRAAEHEHSAAEAMLVAAQRAVERDVEQAYYEIVYFDHALDIVQRNQEVLVKVIEVTASRYAVGSGGQPDVLRAHVDASRLANDAVELSEQRRASLANLNALLDRPTDAPLDAAAIPERIARAAVPMDTREIRFTSAALGARAGDSPLPALSDLQQEAVRGNPDIVAHEAEIRAQAARVERARNEHLPDFDVWIGYGQRSSRPDMISATVSVPIPWQKGHKQAALATSARAELSALEADHHDRTNTLRARVAELYAEIERARAQLALYVKAIVPQGRAALTSAMASYQVGRADLPALLESHATLLSYEIAYWRVLSDFAARLAELEAMVGKEILP